MARRGPLSAAKRKREMEKREKRLLKLARRHERSEKRAQERDDAAAPEAEPQGDT